MESIVSDGTWVMVPPDSSLTREPAPWMDSGFYDFIRRVLAGKHGHEMYRQRQQTIEPVFGHTKHNVGSAIPTTSQIRRGIGMAPHRHDLQPPGMKVPG
jgi:hypothetical protein